MTNMEKLQKMTRLLFIFLGIGLMSYEAKAVEIVPVAQDQLSVEYNKSRLIRLPRAASSVFVANPAVADVQVKSPSLIYLFGKGVGSTTLYAVDGRDRVIMNIDVDVTHNLSRLEKAVARAVPDAKVQFASVNGGLIMEGILNSAREMEQVRVIANGFIDAKTEKLINNLRVDAVNQVNLRVRIAEVSRDINKTLGIDWGAVGTAGTAFSFAVLGSNPFAQGISALGVSTSDISVVLDALEEEGLVSILSEPNLTAMSGEQASFLAGGEFPILYPDGDGNRYVEFREYGVRVSFKPVVLDDGRINLQVAPEVSSLSESSSVSFDGYTIPSLTTRKTSTTVELGSGQSFAIAGLMQNKTGQSLNKFPGLAELPIIGALFKSDSFQREETELVVIVTPYLVKPISHAKAALPMDGLVPPNDMERILLGQTYKQSHKAGRGVSVDQKGRQLVGPVGFELN